jgi:hypothetical protein
MDFMAAPNYVQERREAALAIGLGRPKKPVRCGREESDRPRATGQGGQTDDNAGA